MYKTGKFYNVFGDDAIIIHYLLNYKIVPSKGGTGFPESALNKVINSLEDNKVSYCIYDANNNDFKKLNCYKKVLKQSVKNLSIEERYNKIEKRIHELNSKELEHVLEIIEDAISN